MGQTAQASLFPAKQPSVREPWPLPSGWEWVPLDTPGVAEVIMGQSPPGKSYNTLSEGLPFFQGKAEFGDLYPVAVKWCADARRIALPGDVLMSVRAPVGPTNLANECCCIGRGLAAIRPAAHILTRYLLYAIRVREPELSYYGKGSTFAAVGKNELSAFEIPVPFPFDCPRSLDIQRHIVTRIEALLAEVKEARTLATAIRCDTDRLLAAAVHEVFTSLHPVANIVPLEKVATAFNGRASGEGNSTVRVFKTKHVYPHCLRLDRSSFMKAEQIQQLPRDRYLKPGDVLMTNIVEGTLGRVTYVHECEKYWTVDTQIMILRSLDDRNLLLGKWLYYYLWSERGQQEILARRSGIAFADKRGQTHIYPKNMLGIPVPVPPIEKQIQAVALLDSVQVETEEMHSLQARDAELLDQLEQSILERAFRGEL